MVSKLQFMEYLGTNLSVCYTVSSPLSCGWDFSFLIKFVEVEGGIVLIASMYFYYYKSIVFPKFEHGQRLFCLLQVFCLIL